MKSGGKTIVLVADIDLGNENWTPIGNSGPPSKALSMEEGNYVGGIAGYAEAEMLTNCIALNTGGITCTANGSKYLVSNRNSNNYGSPLIPGTWSNVGDDTFLAWNNYMTAVGTWPSASWSNTKNSSHLFI